MTKSPNPNDGLDDMEPLPEPPGSTARDKDLRIAELEMLLDLFRERMKARDEVRRDVLDRWIADIDFALQES